MGGARMNVARLILIVCILFALIAVAGCHHDEQIIQKHEQMLDDDD